MLYLIDTGDEERTKKRKSLQDFLLISIFFFRVLIDFNITIMTYAKLKTIYNNPLWN